MSWECPECAFLNNNSAVKCICGYEPNTTTDATSLLPEPLHPISPKNTEKAQSSKVFQVYPWRRFGARWIDNNLCGVNIIVTLIIYVPEALGPYLKLASSMPAILSGMLILFVWIFFESFLLSTWGTTPGKWLLGITVRDSEGRKLNFSNALNRSLSVWWKGLGIGFPLISLFTLINAHGELTNNGMTSWDRDGGFSVSHQKIGYLKLILTIFLSIVFILLAVLGLSSEKF